MVPGAVTRPEPLPAGAIVVPAGDVAHGYLHVERKHGAKIETLHPGLGLERYLGNVLRLYQRIF